MPTKPEKPSKVENIKSSSQFLRGTIAEEIANAENHFDSATIQVLKHHGTYQQDDRDLRKEAKKQGSKAYSMMVRSKIPGGKLTSEQLLAEIDLGDEIGNQTLRVTTRQGLQLHGVLKNNLKHTIQRINEIKLSTLAACGDVNRNVMCSPAPYKHNRVYDQIQQLADDLSDAFCPQTKAYHEIWLKELDGAESNGNGQAEAKAELVAGGAPEPENEPLYGPTYLPRKFKTAVALPNDNSTDVFAHDLGYIAIVENGELIGYNVTVGGGMGTTPSAKKTFPALAKVLCFATPEEAIEIGANVIKVQRDFGNRSDRKVARLKYLIDRWGIEQFRAKVEEYYGQPLREAKPMEIAETKDPLGWHEQGDGNWFYGLYVENGRIKDEGDYRLKSALREICTTLKPGIRLTACQNILFTDLPAESKPALEALLRNHGVPLTEQRLPVRQLSMACPAMPTCGLAVAESERFHPGMMDELEGVLQELGLEQESFTLHMTGCPNGCARPYNCDVGIVGKTLGKYTILVGGSSLGTRMNFLYKDVVPGAEVVSTLRPLLEKFKAERQPGERFGDFCDRLGPAAIGAEATERPAEAEAKRQAERLAAEAS